MATDARDERQLMRQRGAGTRDIGDTDFGLDFGAGSRQERQLMRQRGAGNRQINNIDFGFAFATPSTVRGRRSQSRSKTPATATRQSRSLRTTPAPPAQENVQQSLSSARSTRSRQSPVAHRDEPTSQPQRKRRRLSEVSNLTSASAVGSPFALLSSNNIIEEEPEPGQDDTQAPGLGRGSDLQEEDQNAPSSPLFFPDNIAQETNGADKENEHTGPAAPKPSTKKRKRKSIGQQSLFKKKRNFGTPRSPKPTPPETQEETLPVQELRRNSHSARRSRRWSIASSDPPPRPSPVPSPVHQAPNQPKVASEPAPEAGSGSAEPKRRKKRKSIVMGKTKRRSSGAVSTPSQIVSSIEDEDEPPQDEAQAEEEAEGADELNELSVQLAFEQQPEHELEDEQPRSGRKRVSVSARSKRFRPEVLEQVPDGDEDDVDETYLPDDATPEPTPAPKRAKQKLQQKTARHRRSDNATGARPTGVTKRRRRSTFPIMTHRMTNIQALPTIAGEVEEDQQHDSDADELSLPAPPTITTRAMPNAVDVLAQVCRESIDSSISRAKSEGLPRADLGRRVTALESFRTSLDTRLFDLSQSLDQRLTMETRLRKIRREKAELQARWLEIRRQRDQLDLRKDAVRRNHWEGEVLSRKKFEASQAAFGVENALSRDDTNEVAEEGAGLELMLREVAADVSSANGAGMVESLKSFNARLERLAGVLT